MLVSELIKKLEASMKAYGNVEVNLHTMTAVASNIDVSYEISEDVIVIEQVN